MVMEQVFIRFFPYKVLTSAVLDLKPFSEFLQRPNRRRRKLLVEMLSAARAHKIMDVLLQSFWQCIHSPSGRSVHSVARLVTPPGKCFLCRFGLTSTTPINLYEERLKSIKQFLMVMFQ